MEAQLRTAARKYLPGTIRHPLGSVAGRINQRIVEPIQGLLFDLSGGRFRADGCTFSIPKELTTRAYRACFWKGTYEQEERDLVRRWIKPDDKVLELGGCLGIVSCVTNALLADRTKHVVVEGNPFCIATLYRNRELNHSGFLIENCAVAKGPEVIFYLHPVYIVGGSAQRVTERPFRVPAKSLAQLESERGPFTALIIDLEGAEKEIFAESTELLKRYRLIIVELHEFAIAASGVERCRDILHKAGFRLVDQAGGTEAWEKIQPK